MRFPLDSQHKKKIAWEKEKTLESYLTLVQWACT